jgi:restriction endonuclease Mrr
MPDSNDVERYGGVIFAVGKKEWMFAPLSIAAVKRFQKKVNDVTSGKIPQEEQMDVMLEVIGASLRRNYPDLTQELIEDVVIDSTNMRQLFDTVLVASGFKKQAISAGKPEAGSSPTSTT